MNIRDTNFDFTAGLGRPTSNGVNPDVTVLDGPLALAQSDFIEVVELVVNAADLQALGLQLEPTDSPWGRGLSCVVQYQGVRFALSNIQNEGPHYFMLAVDLNDALAAAKLPSQAVAEFIAGLGMQNVFQSWVNTSMDEYFHRKVASRFGR